MSTEEDARLRQVLRMARQLPDPDWNLFRRTTKKWSRLAPLASTVQEQQRRQRKEVPPPAPAPAPAPAPKPTVPLLEEGPSQGTREESAPAPPEETDSYTREMALDELDLDPTASLSQIRKQYLKYVLTHHPDKGGDPAKFRRIRAAYDKLTGKVDDEAP